MAAGAVLVVVLGVSMFNSGISLSGLLASPSVSLASQGSAVNEAQIQGDVQIVNTSLDFGRYQPITVKAGIPVQWTITAAKGTLNGCNSRMVIPEYKVEKQFAMGDNVVEFTPTKAGTYTYSCWMGMVRSTITVVE